MTLGLDFDGVILDIVPLQVALAARAPWHLRVSPQDVAMGRLREQLEWRSAADEFYDRLYGEETHRTFPVPGVADALRRLPEKPYLVSARRGPAVQPVIDWLAAYALRDCFRDVHFVPVSAAKDAACVRLGVDTFVDDQTWVLNLLSSVPRRILFDPWDAAPRSSYLRARSWDEITGLLAAPP